MTDSEPEREFPADLDPGVPNVARIYDAALGGKENYEADRQALDRLIDITAGDVVTGMRENRRFQGRAVRLLTRAGVEQFLDVGTGLPTQDNVHEVAQRANPWVRVVYVDNDPVVVTHGEVLLADTDRVRIIRGDLRRPWEILDHRVVRSLIDFGEPVGILLTAVLHFVTDAEDPGGILACLREAMAPGSHLVLSHGSVEAVNHATEDQDGQVRTLYSQATAPFVPRRRDQLAALLDGFELLDPGVVWAPAWRPDDSEAARSPHRGGVLGVVACRP